MVKQWSLSLFQVFFRAYTKLNQHDLSIFQSDEELIFTKIRMECSFRKYFTLLWLAWHCVFLFDSELLLVCCLDTVTDFLLKLVIKPRKNLLEISIFSLNDVIVRPTKIMNNLLKDCKLPTFKVLFQHQKSTTESSFQWRISG